MIPKQECESEQGNNTPHKPTGWEPVMENLRKIWMKLERPPRAETGPLAVGPGGEGERKEPQNPTSICYKRTEHGQWEEFSMERRDDSMMKKVDAVLFPCPYTRGKVQLRLLQVKCYTERVGTQTLFILSSLNSHLNPANQHEMLPLPWRDTKRLPRTSTDWGRMEEKLENKEGPEEKCTQPDGHRGWEHREQDAHLTTAQLQLTLCSLEATSNLNTAETLI